MQPSTTDLSSLMPSLLIAVGTTIQSSPRVIDSVLTDTSDAASAQGQTIESLFEYDMEVSDVVPSETNPTFPTPKYRKNSITLSEWKNVKFKLPDNFLSGNNVTSRFRPSVVSTAANTMVDHITNAIAKQLRITPNISIVQTTPLGTFSNIVALNEYISSDALSTGRAALFDRKTEASLFDQAQIVTNDYHAPGSAARDGVLPTTMGYSLIPYQPKDKHVSEVTGDITFTLPASMEAHAIYTVTATTASGTAGKKFYPGNILIDQATGDKDITTTICIHEEATITGTSASLKISVSDQFHDLTSGPSVTAKMLKINKDAYMYQKFGIGLSSRPSGSVGFGINDVTFHHEDTINNVAYGIRYLPGYYLQMFALDMLYGTAILNPEYVAREVQIPTANNGYVA